MPSVEPEDVGIESEVDDLDQIRRHLGRSRIALGAGRAGGPE